ncbi:protein dopey-1 homolog isoform X2 [Ischnura elegans]|uniref:protein dopey-1 homolog isoform X2 n=1 Tax=Ischnura elegans TaxID=197161 RepID=UPI001ED893EB|nr:protein dopey-1 homolog isoform X2 [Ischnura elegans]
MSCIALEEYELMKDSKYRVYVSAVDKALKSFEYTSEWADLISALGKLNKVLLNHMKFPVIPRRIKISKRLAQCMHPALPSGVHLKALETYDIIFKCMGTNRLSHELFIYSAGLFPLLGHAAMNVRPSLLTVYETHFVPLGERLRPGLSGFLNGVLPGLEEGSDYFERTNSLLEKVCDGVGGSHFYGCLWECLASNVAIRLPAILFVLSHFNKKLSMEDQLHVMGTNIDVMVSALCAALQDSSVLVQRSTLDLLMVGFPMHSSHLVRSDQGRLVTAALTTVLRRDMSLNRRLFAWLLGSEVNMTLMSSEHPLVKRSKILDNSLSSSNPYFDLYSRDMLIQAIKVVLHTCLNESVPDLRPYRLLVSLLDKPDIGPLILDDILYEVFRTLYLACEVSCIGESCKSDPHRTAKPDAAPKSTSYKGSQELLKTANLLFSTLEPFYIWQYAGSMFETACKNIKEKQSITTSTPTSVSDHCVNGSMSTSGKSQNYGDLRAKGMDPGSSKHLNSSNASVGVVKPVGAPCPDVLEVCALTEFLLDMVSLETYVEIPTEHLPELFLKVITILISYCSILSLNDITSSLGLCQKILSKVQPSSNFQQDSLPPKKSTSVSDTSRNGGYKIPVQPSLSNGQVVRKHSEGDGMDLEFSDTKDLKPKHSVSRSRSASDVFDKRHGSEADMSDGEGESLKDTTDDTFESAVEAGNSEDLWIEGVHNDAEAFGVSSAGHRQQSVMQECLRQYEDFYVKFTCSRVFDSKIDVLLLFTLLLLPRNETDKDRTQYLMNLLQKCIGDENLHEQRSAKNVRPSRNLNNHSSTTDEKFVLRKDGNNSSEKLQSSRSGKVKEAGQVIPLDSIDKISGIVKFRKAESELLEEAVRRACSLLVELSTFPTYCCPGFPALTSLTSEDVKDSNLPHWLQVLLVCCCMGESNSSIQLTSVATFLDLIALLRSVTLTSPDCFTQREELHFGNSDDGRGIPNTTRDGTIPTSPSGADRGVVSVVIVPLLTPYHFHFLEHRTNVFHSVAESLWSCLGRQGSARPWAVRLLYLLHNAVPDGCSDVVEDVILESMVNLGSTESFDRFTALWHLGRDVETMSGSRVPLLGDRSSGRSFDRALLRCLDALALLPASPARLRTEAWLLHSLLRGDASRILEPLLLMLLEPSTARIGVLHVKLQGSDQDLSPLSSLGSICKNAKNLSSEETVESKIYAVSSVDGNVKYHVSGHSSSQPLFSRPSHVPRRIFAITSLQRNHKKKTGRSETESLVHGRRFLAKDSVENSAISSVVKGSMSVFVNPFSANIGAADDMKAEALKFSESDASSENTHGLRAGSSCSDLTENAIPLKTITMKSESLSAPSVVEVKGSVPVKDWDEADLSKDDTISETESSSEDVEEAEAAMVDDLQSLDLGEEGSDKGKRKGSQNSSGEEESNMSTMQVVEEILQEILQSVVERCEGDEAVEAEEGDAEEQLSPRERRKSNASASAGIAFSSSKAVVYPLHSHMLLYVKTYDSHRALYALTTFANLLRADARTVLCAAAAAGISTGPRGMLLQTLLTCHRESVFGRGFNCGSSSGPGKSSKDEKGSTGVYGDGGVSVSSSDAATTFAKGSGPSIGRSSEMMSREAGSSASRASRSDASIQSAHRLSSSAPTLTSIPSPDSSSSSASSFRTSRLLEVALVVCLYYIRSYYPNFLGESVNRTRKNASLGVESKTSNFPGDLELISNRKAKLLSAEVLTLIAAELVQLCGGPGSIVSNGSGGHLASGVGRGFSSYVGDLLSRCKVQKITLHCILSSVHSMKNCTSSSGSSSSDSGKGKSSTFTEEIIRLNDEKCVNELFLKGMEAKDAKECPSAHSESFQIQLLRLLLFLIMLEDQVISLTTEDENISRECGSYGNSQEEMIVHLKYRTGLSIPQQPMFLAAVMNALKLDHMRHLHQHWTSLVTSALPYMGHSLTHVVINVINQLCCNLEKLSQFYKLQPARNGHSRTNRCPEGGFRSHNPGQSWNLRSSGMLSKDSLFLGHASITLDENLPPDYALTQLDSLTLLCHYCLLDSTPSSQQPIFSFSTSSSSTSSNGVSPTNPISSNGQTTATLTGTSTGAGGNNGSISSVANPGQIFSNLVHVFMPTPLSQDGTKEKSQGADPRIAARRTVLCNFPRIIASLSTLWEAVTKCSCDLDDNCNEEFPGIGEGTCGLVLGRRRLVRQHLLEFLSPISLHHGPHFLAAVAIAWQERKKSRNESDSDVCKVLPTPSREQEVLVGLLSSIRAMPVDTLVQTVNSVLRQPPAVVMGGGNVTSGAQGLVLEVSLLEFLFCYLRKSTTARQLVDSWPSLAVLLREGSASSTSSPPAHFLLLALLNEFVQRASPLPEKKDQKELQDITAKLVEVVGQVAGACLEQTTWLRRNLTVKEEAHQDVAANGSKTLKDTKDTSPGSSSNGSISVMSGSVSTAARHSVAAQLVLAEYLAPLLDVTYGSQEKERVVALLTGVMYNITPYLRNHSPRNAASFLACSQLLASISGYQYTRRAWRKDAFELLLDPSLFKMPRQALVYWHTIIDNLMTHDTTTFRDLMARVSMAQSGSLSLFSSREQEYEQRAQLLKRLAFVIFCSETDQYQKYMPEIQERLADSLRLPQVVPSVQAQVFLCFRVLLLRMSPANITSLWPTIISEMVQVFLLIEREFTADSEEFSSHIRLLSMLDSSWVVNSSNGLHAHGHPAWLQLQLAACKLLDLALLLPAHRLPQFQMYRWAFVGGVGASDPGPRGDAEDESVVSEGEEKVKSPEFVPHVTRIARLMNKKLSKQTPEGLAGGGNLLLTMSSIRSIKELHPFFATLSESSFSTAAACSYASLAPLSCATSSQNPLSSRREGVGADGAVVCGKGSGESGSISHIEAVLESDFLENLSR